MKKFRQLRKWLKELWQDLTSDTVTYKLIQRDRVMEKYGLVEEDLVPPAPMSPTKLVDSDWNEEKVEKYLDTMAQAGMIIAEEGNRQKLAYYRTKREREQK